MFIYQVKNKINGKSYIGQTVNKFNKRKIQHLSDARRNVYPHYYFHRAIRKYGEENFEWIILHKNISDFHTLDVLEQLEIIINDSFYNGYNMTLGGEGFKGYKHSQETKNKIGKNNAKYWKNKEIPQDVRVKISNTLKGRYGGEKNPFYGKKHSEETRKKISELNKKRDPNTFYGKEIFQINKDTGKIIKEWRSINCAQKKLKINNISASCSEKQKTAGGYLWIFKKDYNEKYIENRINKIKTHGNKNIHKGN